jgi:hypothetical protein
MKILKDKYKIVSIKMEIELKEQAIAIKITKLI